MWTAGTAPLELKRRSWTASDVDAVGSLLVSLVQWFLTVQQFYLKIVKCLGPLDQGDTGIGLEQRLHDNVL